MKKFDEMVEKMHSHYVADDYIQIMLAYHNYLLLFGNNDLMYFRNFIESHPSISEGSRNVYLDDERKNNFPYSQIPEHIERVLLFRKLNFVNQILDFEKPYIRINDGFITKMTAFKDGDEAIVHTKILNGKLCDKRTKRITREELETYLKTEFCLSNFDFKVTYYDSAFNYGIQLADLIVNTFYNSYKDRKIVERVLPSLKGKNFRVSLFPGRKIKGRIKKVEYNINENN